MRSDDDFIIPDGDFIPGIYNYCDSWCDRCLYTNRCMNYAMGESIEKEIETSKRIERSMKENKAFWDQINQTIEEAAELIDDTYQLKESWHDDESETDDEEAEESLQEYEEIRQKAENHEIALVAKRYMDLAHNWFTKDVKDTLIQEFDNETDKLTCGYPGLNDAQLKQLTEAVELVRWYHMLIWVKIQRALAGQMEEEAMEEVFEGIPKDSDGSAMVAMKGVNASISGWTYLYKIITPEADKIKSFLHMLWWLKTQIENKFPDALSFVWPPKEEE